MKKFRAFFDVEADGISDAYMAARAVLRSGTEAKCDADAPHARVVIGGVVYPIGQVIVMALPEVVRASMRWSATVQGSARASVGPMIQHPRSELAVAFDGESARGSVIIETEGEHLAMMLTPAAMAQLVRALGWFPLDLMDAMAEADERKRRGRK